MYIPLKALQSKKCIQSEELSTHQSIAKALYKYSNKKPKPKRIKDNGENTKSFIIYQTQLLAYLRLSKFRSLSAPTDYWRCGI